MKVLITGATGFIGSHLVEKNLDRGHDVRVLALPDDPLAKPLEQKGLEVVYGDIRDPRPVELATRGIDAVYHLAAVVTDWAPRKVFEEVNIGGIKNVCAAALKAGVDRLVEVSTNDVFGLREDVMVDESFDYATWGEPYADTKIEATKVVWDIHQQGLPVSVAYPCWVYGPGDLTFVPLLADAIKNGKLVFWRKDVLIWPAYVENVVDLLMVLGEHPRAVGEGFLVHDGVSDTLQNFSARIAEAIGSDPPGLHIPYWTAYSASWILETAWKIVRKRTRPLLTRYTVKNLGSRLRFSIDKAGRLLNWSPSVTYEAGFEKTMEWLKKSDPQLWKQK